MEKQFEKELQVLFEIRDALLEIFPEDTDIDTEKYITANELLNKLEKIIREESEDDEFTSDEESDINS
jgi:predicted house-cleaning noncanonical NTP pyrophosphatase (MazG superfamily)